MTELLSGQNTPAIERRIRRAFREWYRKAARHAPRTFFTEYEHGQWWVLLPGDGPTFAVEDAEGGDAVDGFTFEGGP